MNALEVGNQSANKRYGKFGSAVIERMSPCPYCQSKYRGCGCDEFLSTTSPGGVGHVETR